MATVFPFSALLTAALVIDAVYEGGTRAIRRTMFWARPSRRRLSSRLPLGRQLVCAWSSDLLFQGQYRWPDPKGPTSAAGESEYAKLAGQSVSSARPQPAAKQPCWPPGQCRWWSRRDG